MAQLECKGWRRTGRKQPAAEALRSQVAAVQKSSSPPHRDAADAGAGRSHAPAMGIATICASASLAMITVRFESWWWSRAISGSTHHATKRCGNSLRSTTRPRIDEVVGRFTVPGESPQSMTIRSKKTVKSVHWSVHLRATGQRKRNRPARSPG
jgi:hypothetical protein